LIPVLAGILAVAALFLMSMPFVLVRSQAPAQLPSEQHGDENGLAQQARAEEPGAAESCPDGTGHTDGTTPDRPGPDCDLDPAGMSLVLQPIRAIE
jgi:hypothetical protein